MLRITARKAYLKSICCSAPKTRPKSVDFSTFRGKSLVPVNRISNFKSDPARKQLLSGCMVASVPSKRFLTSENTTAPELDLDLASITNATGDVLTEPSFHSIGLGGATPAGLLQSLMEQAHIQLDLPWWATIAISTVILRTLLFPVILKAQKNMIAMNNVLPEQQRLQLETMRTDLTAEQRQRAYKEFHKFCLDNNSHPLMNIIPMVGQGAVFLSMFFALRGMATCPVESMKTGGLFWFTDLCVQDPFYALPVITSLSLFIHIKLGADGVDVNTMPKFFRAFMLALPFISLPVMCQFPAALNVYWLTTNLISITQSRILRLEPVRQRLGLGKMIHWKPEQLPMNSISLFSAPPSGKASSQQQAMNFGPYANKIRQIELKEKLKREQQK